MSKDTTVADETSKVKITFDLDVVDNVVYSHYMEEWEDSDSEKEYTLMNRVGLRCGHNNKARIYAIRASENIVQHAHCNQLINKGDENGKGVNVDSDLITDIFTLKLYDPTMQGMRKLETLGYGVEIDGIERDCWTLTGGLRRVKDNAFTLSAQDRAHSLIQQAVAVAEIEGMSTKVFSNESGRNMQAFIKSIKEQTGENSPYFAGYADAIRRKMTR